MTIDGEPINPEALTPGHDEAGQRPPAAAADVVLGGGFSHRVLVYFLTQVLTAGLGLFNGFLLARLIGPDGRGEFYLLTFYPTTLMVLGQLGLPQAFTFFSARRMFEGLIARTVLFAAVVATVLMIATIALLPTLEGTVMRGLEPFMILLGASAVPFMLHANFTTGIVVGRQAATPMAWIYVGVNALTTALLLIFVAVLNLGVGGAVLSFVVSAIALAGAFLALAVRVTRAAPSEGGVSTARTLGYALPFFPASLSAFFAARADVFLLAALLAEPAAPIGYYSLAVAIAELVFMFPNAVATFFFPHVAGERRDEVDRQLTVISRVTLLLTGLGAVVLAPAATIAILVLIPSFAPALAALYLLLGGATLVGPTRVLTGYLAGLGRPGLASAVSLSAVAINVVLNLVFIPALGIVGAGLAMLTSSVLSSALCSVIASRLSGEPVVTFWVPRMSDVRLVVTTVRGSLSRRFRRAAPSV